MYRRSTAAGRYLPAFSRAPSSSRICSTPCSSIAAIVSASTPAAPRFALTRFHASRRTSLLHMRSYNAWNRRSGCCFAATYSRRWSCRTLSRDLGPSGSLGRFAAMPSRLPPLPTLPPQGPFPPAAFFVTAIFGTTVLSDSRCAALAFAFGLYEPPCRDGGCADGPLVFRTSPCTRAAPSTPEEFFGLPVSRPSNVAFAVT